MNIDQIIRYEQGDLPPREFVEMFAEGIADGTVWQLQGHYGRTAQGLIDLNLIDRQGNVDWDVFAEIEEA